MKVILFLADGFEEVEAITVVDYLRRVGIDIQTVSITDELLVRGSHDIKVMADQKIADLHNIDGLAGMIIPGGLPGATNLRDDQRVINFINDANKENKMIAAICAGPIVPHKAGILKDKKITSYPGLEDQLKGTLYMNAKVVRDNNIITAQGPSLAVDFAIAIVEYLLNKRSADELKESILYDMSKG